MSLLSELPGSNFKALISYLHERRGTLYQCWISHNKLFYNVAAEIESKSRSYNKFIL